MAVYSIVANEDDDSLYYHDIRLLDLAVNTGYTTYEIIDSVQAFSTPTSFCRVGISVDDVDTLKTTMRVCINKVFSVIINWCFTTIRYLQLVRTLFQFC
jgi:hypothetical protein